MAEKTDLNSLMSGLGASAIIMNAIGGMMNMFGEKTPEKLAEDLMAGAVRGILDHFEWKLDDLKRQIDNLSLQNQDLLDELEKKNVLVEELTSRLQKYVKKNK